MLLDYNKKPVDLSEDFTVATSNIITKLAFGKAVSITYISNRITTELSALIYLFRSSSQYKKSSAHLQEMHSCLNKIVSLWGSPWISALDSFPLLRVTHSFSLKLTIFFVSSATVLILFTIISLQRLPNPPFTRLMKEVARRDELIGGHLDQFKVQRQCYEKRKEKKRIWYHKSVQWKIITSLYLIYLVPAKERQ